jgi:transcriptional regulator with XRE-family HTH domain
MSQCELGAAVGRPQSSISQWENGLVDLSMEQVAEIEKVLGVPAGSLGRAAGYVDSNAPSSEPVRPDVSDDPLGFAGLLVSWLWENGALIESLALLDRIGDAYTAEALRSSRPVEVLRASWDLQAELAGGGLDAELARWIGSDRVNECRRLLWPTDCEPHLRLVNETDEVTKARSTGRIAKSAADAGHLGSES